MSPHASSYTEAIQAFQFYTAFWGGWTPVRLGSWAESETIWRQGPSSDLPALVADLDARHDDDVLLGLAQPKPFNGGVGLVSCLWCRVTGSDQLARARAFKPYPSLVLQEGAASSRVLFWGLSHTITWPEALAANKKIAYRLRAVQKLSDPDLLWINAPGTCLRRGRVRPAPVRVARLTLETFKETDLTRGLKTPPESNWWEKAA